MGVDESSNDGKESIREGRLIKFQGERECRRVIDNDAFNLYYQALFEEFHIQL